jgi:uncharacterized phage protein (TIGR01671 family)
MREIKFRVYDTLSKQILSIVSLDFKKQKWSGVRSEGELWHGFFPEVHLMQYTGLKDKNGREIYESDIVEYYYCKSDCMKPNYEKNAHEIKTSEVIFDYGMFGVEGCAINLSHVGIRKQIEVIGNIYENPELLKEILT